ncbi:GIY-YIG nuclease family protein [Dokdonia sp.]|uniref:GIY-YIG nuclease family protein n=1 Tax=Dokdonia sp. TaxID=2024995 RepID=UPI0032646DD2
MNLVTNLIEICEGYYSCIKVKICQELNPSCELVTTWTTPAPELDLKRIHNQFKKKRRDGEWFNLNFNDLRYIKDRMEKYKAI